MRLMLHLMTAAVLFSGCSNNPTTTTDTGDQGSSSLAEKTTTTSKPETVSSMSTTATTMTPPMSSSAPPMDTASFAAETPAKPMLERVEDKKTEVEEPKKNSETNNNKGFFASIFSSNSDSDKSKDGNTRSIKSVTFVQSSPPNGDRRKQTLVVNSDLSTEMTITDGYSKVLSSATGKISRSQFDALTTKLNTANYIRLRPSTKNRAAAGSGTQTLIISSDLGAHRFVNNPIQGFPDEIQDVYALKTQFLPQN